MSIFSRFPDGGISIFSESYPSLLLAVTCLRVSRLTHSRSGALGLSGWIFKQSSQSANARSLVAKQSELVIRCDQYLQYLCLCQSEHYGLFATIPDCNSSSDTQVSQFMFLPRNLWIPINSNRFPSLWQPHNSNKSATCSAVWSQGSQCCKVKCAWARLANSKAFKVWDSAAWTSWATSCSASNDIQTISSVFKYSNLSRCIKCIKWKVTTIWLVDFKWSYKPT